MYLGMFFLMRAHPPKYTLPDTLFPDTTLFLSGGYRQALAQPAFGPSDQDVADLPAVLGPGGVQQAAHLLGLTEGETGGVVLAEQVVLALLGQSCIGSIAKHVMVVFTTNVFNRKGGAIQPVEDVLGQLDRKSTRLNSSH